MYDKFSIMIVDDDPLLGGMLGRYLLEKSGFQVHYYDSPLQAYSNIQKIKPDMIILDWMMPKLSGLQFLIKLRKENSIKDTPVFMLTAKRQGTAFETACNAGADAFLTKPVDFYAINNRIVRYLSNA